MNRQQRRTAKSNVGSVVRDFVDNTLLLDAPNAPIVGIGPIVWAINPNDGRHWYFVCASADATDRFHLDSVKIPHDDRELAERTRAAILLELVARKPIFINDFDDEQNFAAFCASVWPSERTRRLNEAVKADYASRPPDAA